MPPLVDTGQNQHFDNVQPVKNAAPDFPGKDADYSGAQPSYRDNSDGTVTDLVTGLIWSKAVDSKKGTPERRKSKAMTLAGHDDWRLPNAKELQSLVDYTRPPPPGQSDPPGRRTTFAT